MVTTLDLSAVERDIKQLKQQQQQLEQKLNSAAEEQKKDIQVELDRVIQELKRKDTDTYRDSHAYRRQCKKDRTGQPWGYWLAGSGGQYAGRGLRRWPGGSIHCCKNAD